MSTQTWQKACTCEGATATTGRIVIGTEKPHPLGYAFGSRVHPGPVCDKCDTPWTLTSEPRPS